MTYTDSHVDVGGDGEAVDPGMFHFAYPLLGGMQRGHVQQDRGTESTPRLDCGREACDSCRSDQQDDVGAGLGGLLDLVTAPIRGHHLGNHAGSSGEALDLLNGTHACLFEQRITDLDEVNARRRQPFGNVNCMVEVM